EPRGNHETGTLGALVIGMRLQGGSHYDATLVAVHVLPASRLVQIVLPPKKALTTRSSWNSRNGSDRSSAGTGTSSVLLHDFAPSKLVMMVEFVPDSTQATSDSGDPIATRFRTFPD